MDNSDDLKSEIFDPIITEDDPETDQLNNADVVLPTNNTNIIAELSDVPPAIQIDENNEQSSKDMIVTSSQYLNTKCNMASSDDTEYWNSHATMVTPPNLCNHNIIEGTYSKEIKDIEISSSAETLEDKLKSPMDSDEETDDINISTDIQYVRCIAAIKLKDTKIIEISILDPYFKVDVKSEGSLSGYIADHSGSSISSTIEEKFLIPKVPSYSILSVSSSSSSSSSNVHLQQIKSKQKKITLMSKNNLSYTSLSCPKCKYLFPTVKHLPDYNDAKYEGNTAMYPEMCNSKNTKNSNSKRKNEEINKTHDVKLEKETIITEDKDNELITKQELEQIPDTQLVIDSKITVSFDIGSKVFAYWIGDKMFYPATIIDRTFPKFKVEFLSDHLIKSLTEDGLVHSDALRTEMSIGVIDNVSQEYKVGDIITIPKIIDDEQKYKIDFGSEIVDVPFEKLVLNTEQAKMVQELTVHKNVHDLSSSEASTGKRIRLSRSTNIKKNLLNKTANESTKRKKCKQTDVEKKRKCLFPKHVEPKDVPSTSTGITVEAGFNAHSRRSLSESEFEDNREDVCTIDMSKLNDSQIDSEYSSAESVTKIDCNENTKIKKVFSNLNFVITYSKYKRRPMPDDSDKSSEDNDDTTQDPYDASAVDKRSLNKKIMKYGGTTFRRVNEVPKSLLKSCYLITDTPSQTCNFFLALALGVPAYHINLIHQAVEGKRMFNEVISGVKPISNGYSLEQKKMIYRSPNAVRSKIFDGFIIYVALGEKWETKFWASLLTFTGAIVYTSWKNGIKKPLTSHTTVILTDKNCPIELQRADVPKVSKIWVNQCLICESARPLDGHDDFIAFSDID
ncbi:TP53-binding protein 1-like [Adelges cooleyi]|uniref:TP53-binding protein 1-like n=1 Tax=Adelges cooleyi TaxID=133065 RepID=UPI00217F231B|nr:TP53-binding protein 1-like [Adelges cooleyi]